MLALLFTVFVILLVLGLDLFSAMGAASLVYLLATRTGDMPLPLTLIPQQLVGGVDSFPLLAIPMFLLAGELMTRGGVTTRLINFAAVLVGQLRGGLAQVSIVTNVIMAGMSGSAVADAAATGSVLIPGMVKRGYTPEYAAAVIAAAACIGPIIPPSLMFVVLGSMVSVSVGQLFAAGIIPGLLMAVAMMAVVYRQSFKINLPVEQRATLPVFWKATREAALPLGMPVVILGAILSGFATPTEASVVAVVYAFVLGLFVYREIKYSELLEIFSSVAITSASVMVTVAAAQLFGWITTAEGLGKALGVILTSFTREPWVFLMIVNVVLLVLGTVMEPIPIMVLTVPILYPVATQLGIDPVHFGLVIVLNLMIGSLTPPVGVNIFVTAAMAKVPVMRVAREAMGFIWILILVLLVITYIPKIVLWLPEVLYR
ncbi:MAG: TRAP transporter large permease [Rhodoferax sp.]|nr:TRAP transporter large permease [Rhodoferax sp.]